MFRFKRSSSSSSLPPPFSLRFSGVNSPQVHRSTALRVVPLERSIFARRANNSIVPPPDGCSHNKTHNSTLNCCLTSPCLALRCTMTLVACRPQQTQCSVCAFDRENRVVTSRVIIVFPPFQTTASFLTLLIC